MFCCCQPIWSFNGFSPDSHGLTGMHPSQVNSYIAGAIRSTKDSTSMNVEDYPSFDPAPSSKATIKTGPIEHGIPLMPYIPRPTPPGHRKHGGSPWSQLCLAVTNLLCNLNLLCFLLCNTVLRMNWVCDVLAWILYSGELSIILMMDICSMLAWSISVFCGRSRFELWK